MATDLQLYVSMDTLAMVYEAPCVAVSTRTLLSLALNSGDVPSTSEPLEPKSNDNILIGESLQFISNLICDFLRPRFGLSNGRCYVFLCIDAQLSSD